MKAPPRDPVYSRPLRWPKLYERHFPHRTDPTSRHVKVIAEGLRSLRSPLREALAEFEPDHMAHALEQTVKMLWEAREEIEKLQAANTQSQLEERSDTVGSED